MTTPQANTLRPYVQSAAYPSYPRTLLLLGEDFLDVLPLVFEFLGVADPERPAPRIDPEQKQRQMAEFLRRVVRLQSARAPMVALIDDIQWIDRASDEVVAPGREFSEPVPRGGAFRDRPRGYARARGRSWSGHGPPLGIVADAGTGKSRLCCEFAERCRAHEIPVYEAQASPTGRPCP